MKTKLNKVLKFLFPEWQIYDDFKQHGFIAKRTRRTVSTSDSQQMLRKNRNQNSISTDRAPSHNTRTQQNLKTELEHVPNKFHKQIKKHPEDKINKIFENIRLTIGQQTIGQYEYLDQLNRAFKRPFVTGIDPVKPKNSMIIFGHPGSGRKTSIFSMAKQLKENKLISHHTVSKIDLASYTTATEYNLFLSDLYKCLYATSDIVLFENIEKAPSNVFEAISQLTMTGTYSLQSRYTVEQNKLIEATGTLSQQMISEIYANRKYFIFLFERSEEDLYHMFGNHFMDSIGDLIHTDPFSKKEIQQLTIKIFDQLKHKCATHLSISLVYDQEIVENIADQFNSKTGINGLQEIVDQNIYQALAELKLRNSKPITETVMLKYSGEKYIAEIGSKEFTLDEYLRDTSELSIDDIKKELNQIVGIDRVKQYILQLEDNLKIQQLRESKGFAKTDISMHMVFTGNPGTGKTTIARIVAKYLKAIGVLSTGQLREVTRADLVGEYVGQTARLTNDVIKSALGGVLFIDEAYALFRDEHDTFGMEAIDTIVKGMEDYRDELVVILAGYSDEMEMFLNANPGLKSRFPNIVHFEDYTPEEMWEIAKIISKQKGYKIANNCKEPLIKRFEKRQIKGKNDSGNGRLVRNIIEAAILHQSQRLMKQTDAPFDLLIDEDFNFEDHSSFDLEASLSQIVGLENVKDFVRTQQNLLIAQKKREKAGLTVDTTQSLHMVFSGNPGTGKTTIARIMANMFKDMGLLKSGHLVEVDSGGLTGQYAGHTAKKTEEVFRSALGGVLFIDEAYALASNTSSYGTEAINTLVKLIEDFREDIVVILAGYEQEMKDFLKTNTGLESRFPLRIHFPDYTAHELLEIAQLMISSKGFTLTDESKTVLREQLELMHKQASDHSGNGRMVRNYIEEITRNQSARIAMNDVAVEDLNVILPQDINPTERVLKNFDLETELAGMIGLDEVKDYIRSLHARLRIQSERKKLGLPVDETQTLHMIFTGNPGTGKTMMARIVANVLYNLGMIQTNKLIETDRAGLVAGYVGQTAIKTQKIITEALDGVLFIDEAYALAQGGANDFGKEAIDTLVKMMDDHRDRLVVILAGYSKDMEQFLLLNPGLQSRFPNIIEFADYGPQALMEIAKKFYHDHGFKLTEDAKEKLAEVLIHASQQANFGNGRFVRNVYERSLNQQANRLSHHQNLTEEDLTKITADDIEEV